MVQFKTDIQIDFPDFQLSYGDTILSLGSCFAQNIAQKLEESYYNVYNNPFGTLYNPISIRNSLALLLNEYEFEEDDLFQHKGIWSSFQYHSSFSGIEAPAVLEKINTQLTTARAALQKTNVLLITLGTAWVYELKKTKKVVSNCHKLPSNRFVRRRLEVDEIIEKIGTLLLYLKKKLPQLNVLLTVSPIRHLKDGFVENQISKSTLLLATHQLVKNNAFIHYFPAYEIVLDDLRDYRFYAKDLVHPNDLAIDYIWTIFSENYLNPKENTLRKNITKLKNAIRHRSFFPESEAHQKFIQKQLQLIEKINQKATYINLEKAKKHFESQVK